MKSIVTSAPGRMDVMGGIADYSGSLVLQMPIKETTKVELSINTSGIVDINSSLTKGEEAIFKIEVSKIAGLDYQEARKIILNENNGDWALYVVGCFLVLNKEKKVLISGAKIKISSTVPTGKGVSSSAALEVAVMCAINKAYKLKLGKTELPLLAQKVENLVVGAACGLMDQLSSYLGEKNKLLPIICQPVTVFPSISIPNGIIFCGIDSGIKHAVSGASYGDVRIAAFMGYSIIASASGTTKEELLKAKDTGDWSMLPFGGYLGNIAVSVFDQKFYHLLPEFISGKDFLKKYECSIDGITTIDPDKDYAVRASAKHPVYENFRINTFYQLLLSFERTKEKEAVLRMLGEFMFQTHISYSSVSLGNDYTDEIVEMVREAGYNSGMYGAKITGGGNGGTVCILCYGSKGLHSAKNIHKKISEKYGKKLAFFEGSSSGGLKINK